MNKPKKGQFLTYIPSNLIVEVIHVPDYHDVNSDAIIIVRMKSGHNLPVPVSQLESHLTTDPPKPPVKFKGLPKTGKL